MNIIAYPVQRYEPDAEKEELIRKLEEALRHAAFLQRQLDLERIRRKHDKDVETLRKKNHALAKDRDTLRTLVRRYGTQLETIKRQATESPTEKLLELYAQRGRKIESLQRQLRERNLNERW